MDQKRIERPGRCRTSPPFRTRRTFPFRRSSARRNRFRCSIASSAGSNSTAACCRGRGPSVPLLERLKFLAITASNLDEFFQVRVAGPADLIAAGIAERTADGLTPSQQMKGIRQRTKGLLSVMYKCLDQSIFPELRKAGIRIDRFDEFSKKEQAVLREHYEGRSRRFSRRWRSTPGIRSRF